MLISSRSSCFHLLIIYLHLYIYTNTNCTVWQHQVQYILIRLTKLTIVYRRLFYTGDTLTIDIYVYALYPYTVAWAYIVKHGHIVKCYNIQPKVSVDFRHHTSTFGHLQRSWTLVSCCAGHDGYHTVLLTFGTGGTPSSKSPSELTLLISRRDVS